MSGMKKSFPKIENINTDEIQVCDGRRPIDDVAVTVLAASMEKIGLKIPISVRLIVIDPDDGGDYEAYQVIDGGTHQLVAGAHRLAAAKKLGWKFIECFVVENESDEQAKLWEIAENLHRAELTVLERSHHIAEWIRLTNEIDASQVGTHEPRKAGQQPGGINKAERELGLGHNEAHRATKIASLTPEAEKVAIEVGLDDNASALLAAKDKSGDATKEIANLRAARARKDAADVVRKSKPAPAFKPGHPRHTLAEIEAMSVVAPGIFNLKVLSPPSERANYKETFLSQPYVKPADKYLAAQEAKLGPVKQEAAALPIDLAEIKGGLATLSSLGTRLGRYVMTDFDEALALAKRALESRLAA
jgi:hypothetical protein